ncbi:hypothetical protein IWX78_000001 [Mycetocola sp. CAN_C7]|uniref:hypothetical protein n=1 Tax=Mycetocola sp. CAN_C7 TaxID=2787724 RepID=UPI0018C8E100
MERIHYAGTSFLTGDLIARAFVGYARFLSAHRISAAVTIPVRHPDGTTGRANFLLGPTSELVSVSESSDLDSELLDLPLVDELRELTNGMRTGQAGPMLAKPSLDSFTPSELAEMA